MPARILAARPAGRIPSSAILARAGLETTAQYTNSRRRSNRVCYTPAASSFGAARVLVSRLVNRLCSGSPMAWKTVGCWALRINVVLLFALALWFRITSLGSMPEIIGDELWMGTQLVHFLAGKSISVWYFSGSPMNPFFAGMDLLLHLIFKPSIWLVRIVPAFCGVLAVVLTYVLGARMLDRTTALIASVLLAVLPIAIIFSRIGYDAAQTPLFSLIALYFAFK